MRIALLTTSFPARSGDAAGHFVAADAEALARNGHEVHVLAPGGSFFGPSGRWGNVTVHPCGGGATFGWPGVTARLRAAPWRLVGVGQWAVGVSYRTHCLARPDALRAHWLVPSAWPLGALVARRFGCSLEAVAHGGDVRLLLALPAPLRTRITRALLAACRQIEFASNDLSAAFAGGLPADLRALALAKSSVVPPTLDLPPRAELRPDLVRARLRIAPDERLVVFAGRLVADKRPCDAILAASLCGGAVALAMAGDGPELATAARLAERAGCRTLMLGQLERARALALLAAADVVLHPSRVDAAPSVVREARAYGVPVIAYPAGDVPRWAMHDGGIDIAETPEAMAVALRARLLHPARRAAAGSAR